MQSDTSDSSNGLIPITLPGSDTAGALLIPTTGASRVFSISGLKTGTEAEITTFIAKLQKWVNDGGDFNVNNLVYVSTLDGTTLSVRALKYNKSWVAGNPRILNYNLELSEGTFVGETP